MAFRAYASATLRTTLPWEKVYAILWANFKTTLFNCTAVNFASKCFWKSCILAPSLGRYSNFQWVMLWSDFDTARVSLTDAAMCMNLTAVNASLFKTVTRYIVNIVRYFLVIVILHCANKTALHIPDWKFSVGGDKVKLGCKMGGCTKKVENHWSTDLLLDVLVRKGFAKIQIKIYIWVVWGKRGPRSFGEKSCQISTP